MAAARLMGLTEDVGHGPRYLGSWCRPLPIGDRPRRMESYGQSKLRHHFFMGLPPASMSSYLRLWASAIGEINRAGRSRVSAIMCSKRLRDGVPRRLEIEQ